MKRPIVFKEDLAFPELSYNIVGCAFEVMKELGSGHKEKIYQAAMSRLLLNKKIAFEEQVYYPVLFQGKTIGKNYFDFLIEKKIIVEIKKNFNFSSSHILQVLNYLKVSGLKLAILINFGKEGATFKRIVNISKNPL